MPCRTDDWILDPRVPTEGEKAITRNRELTNMLCAMCTTFLSGSGGPQNTAIKQADGTSFNKEVWNWWAEHLEEDQKRANAKIAREALAKKRRQALAKLSAEEIEMLKIKI